MGTAMSDGFDPYHVWLGIPPGEQPPHHYRLLAISLFEAAPEVIENAAERQMAHVRRAAHGKHADESQRVLNEIAAAQRTLLDGARKTEYDNQLRAKLGPAARGYEQTAEWQPAPVVPSPALPPLRQIAAVPPSSVAVAPATKWKKPPARSALPEVSPIGEVPLASPMSVVSTASPVRMRAKRRFPALLVVALAAVAILPVLALLGALALSTREPAVASEDETPPAESSRDEPRLPRVGEGNSATEKEVSIGGTPTSSSLPKPGGDTSTSKPSTVANDPRDPLDNSPSFGRLSEKPVLQQTVTVSAKTLLPRLAFLSLPAEARAPIELKAGQIVKMKIDGAWRIGPGGDQVRGVDALFIAVGHAGQPASQFAQGAANVEFNVQKDGWLFMGIEDLFNFDNAGEMTVEICVY